MPIYVYDTPKIAFHGGKCCGIKVIHTLGYNPNGILKPLEKDERTDRQRDADQYGNDVHSAFNVFYQAAPEETVAERVKRYVEFLDAFRPHGIIEIVLADNIEEDYNQILHWGDIIKELGFVEVSNCYNSNSSNRIHIFHRTTDQ